MTLSEIFMSKATPKEYCEVLVKKVTVLNECYFILESEEVGIIPAAGQFYLLKSGKDTDTLLHIPLSINDIDNSRLLFMIKKIGAGTNSLAKLKENDSIKMLGPLGSGFKMTTGKKVLLVSGGIGYAPLSLLKNHLLAANNSVLWLHGGRTSDDIFPADIIYTEDGSAGKKGLVTEGLYQLLYKNDSPLNTYDMIFCCGPRAMMYKAWQIAGTKNIPVQVSLEEYMACGLGACLGCAVKIKSGEKTEYKTVCKDGPVFNADEVVWE